MNTNIENALTTELRNLNDDPDFATVFHWLAGRQKDSRETRVERAAKKTKLDYKVIRSIFQKFDELEIGKYIQGRKGSASRLEWYHSLKSIGRAAKGDDISDFGIDFDNLIIEEDEEVDHDNINHRFPLRKGVSVGFNLPADFTKSEAERLSGFILSLPI